MRIVWPTCAQESEAVLTSTVIANPTSRRGRILVAEDDEIVCGFVSRMLRRAGFEVSVASNGSEALALASSLDAPPGSLLTDVIMPGLTGPQLEERFHRVAPEVPVLFRSRYLDDVLAAAPFSLVEDLITRPFTARDLLARIDAKLSGTKWSAAASGELRSAQESTPRPTGTSWEWPFTRRDTWAGLRRECRRCERIR